MLEAYRKPHPRLESASVQLALSFGLFLYLFIYAFEAPVRWFLNMAHADDMIFLRDVMLEGPVAMIFVQQVFARKVHPAFIVFLLLLLLHGTVSILNIRSPFVVIYSTKIFLGMLAGAIAWSRLFRPSRSALVYFGVLWVVTAVGVVLDKYFYEFPWVGMTAHIGGVDVDISRDWEIKGADKRAGGFMRSSINVAFFETLISLTLLFNIRQILPKILIGLVTLFIVYCSTQKGAILAYGLTFAILMLSPRRPLTPLKFGVLFFLTACILLPIVLPQYVMPSTAGVFSMASFYDRVEGMWPHAWSWINRRQVFPLGVGLGGIGGAQRFYAGDEVNAADNLFVILYAFFGVMSFVYLGWIAWCVARLRRNTSAFGIQALGVLTFLFADGCVLSVLEDQMGELFFGAALATLGSEVATQKTADKIKDKIIGIPKWQLEANLRRKALRDGVLPAAPGKA